MLNNGIMTNIKIHNYHSLILVMILVLTSSAKKDPISIYKNWYSNKRKICMNLNKRGYSRIAELDNIKVKIQGDNLKIFYVYNPKSLFGGRLKYDFHIDKLSKDTLIISQDSVQNKFEEMPDSQITFIAIKCSDIGGVQKQE